jgi:2-dehydropantoate 2-reductase
MKIAVMGSGGVGGYFGGRLAAAGSEVSFIARGRHAMAMATRGLRLQSTLGDTTLPSVRVVEHPAEIERADVVLFTVKMGDTDKAADAIAPLVERGAHVFTFQNGVQSHDRLTAKFGKGVVVPGVARISAYILEPGVIEERGRFAVLEFGEAQGGRSARTEAFLAECLKAGIDAHLREDITRAIWMKFAMLAPFAGMTSLARGPIGPIRSTPAARALLERAVTEVVALGRAHAASLTEADTAAVMAQIDKLPVTMMSSMSQDLIAGKPIEVEGLSGAVVALSVAHRLQAPTHEFIAAALSPFVHGKPAV